MKDLKILFAGNVANVGYLNARLMRKNGIPAYLLMEKNPSKAADPLSLDPNLKNVYPDWIFLFDKNKSSWKMDILKIMRNFELIQTHYEFAIFAYLSRKPFVVHLTGSDIRKLPSLNSLKSKLLNRAYKKAKAILFDGPTEQSLLSKLNFTNGIFFPMILNDSFFKPEKILKKDFKDKFVIFHPTNLNWEVKGNDILVKGFIQFARNNKNSILFVVDHGPDSKNTHQLVQSSGLENQVHFIDGPLNSTQLRYYYNISDVIADQFVWGDLGNIARETLSSGKPLLAYFRENEYEKLYGEALPALNAKTVSDIIKKLEILKDEKIRMEIGKKGNDLIKKYHSSSVIFNKMKILYESILADDKIEEIR